MSKEEATSYARDGLSFEASNDAKVDDPTARGARRPIPIGNEPERHGYVTGSLLVLD